MGKTIKTFYYGDYGVDMYNNGVIVHEDTIKADPKFVRDSTHAVMEAWAWSLLNLDQSVKNFLQFAPGRSEPIIRGHLAIAIEHLFDDGVRRHGLGYTDHQKMDYTVEILTNLQKLKKRIPHSRCLYESLPSPVAGHQSGSRRLGDVRLRFRLSLPI